MKLARIGVANYRSIGETSAIIDLRRRVTIVIGANNSGKSNVLAALGALREHKGILNNVAPTDRHLRDTRISPRVVVDTLVESKDDLTGFDTGEILRFVYEFGDPGQEIKWIEQPFRRVRFDAFNQYFAKKIGRRFTGTPSEKDLESAFAEVCSRLVLPLLQFIPKVVFIPQHRQIAPAPKYAIGGTGIVELLSEWERPEIGRDSDKERFKKVQDLLRRLLHLPGINLEVTHDKKTMVVDRGGLRLPLGSYGTGIHQLIIVAVAVLAEENAIICIEEPEVNLHPTLQRELLRFLMDETSNNYVISTHSHALVEPNTNTDVMHVTLEGSVTVPREVDAPQKSLAILRDLGVRASDLLQANSVIWVEGPSDRIYIKRWLALLAPELIEGIHFSVMFYGGRLLSHLSLERPGGTSEHDFIQLLRINQSSVVVIDSDKTKKGQKLNKTKIRIKEEAEKEEIYCWITDGREIENYLPASAIAEAYGVLVGHTPTLTFGQFDSLEETLRRAVGDQWHNRYSYDAAKAVRAREIVRHISRESVETSLRRHLQNVIGVINSASELHHEKISRDLS